MQPTRRVLRNAVAASALTMLACLPRVAGADDSSTLAAATVLFDEGVKLMETGRHADACPKLARSQALAPSGGTLLVLGECYEKMGRTASAWVAFREAAARAAGAGKRDAEVSALERASRLEPKLPRVTLSIPAASRTAGLEVRRDGVVVKEAELGVPVPADPGAHEIQASAPHMKPLKKTITVRSGEMLDFSVPPLAPETVDGDSRAGSAAPIPPTEPPYEEPASTGTGQRVAGGVVAGVGVASLVVGGVFGLLAKSKNDKALEPQNCPRATQCTPAGLDLTDAAKSRALVSTILVAAGAAFVIGGGILFFTAPRRSDGSTTTAKAGTIRITPGWSPGTVFGAADLTW